MRGLHWENFAALTRQLSPDQRRAASIAAVTHALHDGYTDLIYIMLPLWQAEFGLDYAALGVLRGVFVGAMASLQIPAGLASEKLGAALVLALGTALAGLGYCLAGSAPASPCCSSRYSSAGSAPAPSIRSHPRWSPAPLPARARSRRSAPTISPATSAR